MKKAKLGIGIGLLVIALGTFASVAYAWYVSPTFTNGYIQANTLGCRDALTASNDCNTAFGNFGTVGSTFWMRQNGANSKQFTVTSIIQRPSVDGKWRLGVTPDPVAQGFTATALASGLQLSDNSGYLAAPPPVPGCTDPTATNYNANATQDDGSCTYPPPPVPGCTDPAATNYDPNATTDNGSCTYPPDPILGCTDPEATNYNEQATEDDDSCTYDTEPPPTQTPAKQYLLKHPYPDAIVCYDPNYLSEYIHYLHNVEENGTASYNPTLSFNPDGTPNSGAEGTNCEAKTLSQLESAGQTRSFGEQIIINNENPISTDPVQNVVLAGILMILTAFFIRRNFFA